MNKLMRKFALATTTIIALALFARFIPGPRTIDDSYITFRYARNILAGQGFVYNPGERLLGTTTPLYTLLLSFAGRFLGNEQADFPFISLIVNGLADAITCCLLIKLGQKLGSLTAGLATALAWSIAPFSVTFAIGGLETSLLVVFMVLFGYLYLLKRYLLCALIASFLLLIRPDTLILITPVILDRLIGAFSHNSTHITLPEIAALIIPYGAWAIFALFYFGSPLPHSITAKTLAYHLPPLAALTRLLQHYATPFMEDATFGIPAIGIGLLLYPFASIIGCLRARKIISQSIPILVYPWLYFLVFSIANPLIFRWYLTPPLPFYMLSIFLGIEKILLDILKKANKPSSGFHKTTSKIFQSAILLFLFVIPFAFLARNWAIRPDHGLTMPAPMMSWYKLELLYQEASNFLNTRLKPGDIVAAGDVGVVGYITNAPILDTVGLNSAITTRYYPLDDKYYAINYAIPPDLILDTRPDYIVILEVYGRKGLLIDERFKNSYRLIKKIATDIYGSNGMLIFQSYS
jgi:hypothetical protein